MKLTLSVYDEVDIGVIPYQVTQGLPVQIIDFDDILLI